MLYLNLFGCYQLTLEDTQLWEENQLNACVPHNIEDDDLI